jgi:diguanylate cyclase (GGDEF)-like protein
MNALEVYAREVSFQLGDPDRRKSFIIRSFCVIFIDIDHFKNINDTYGHPAGDVVLQEVAQAIKRNLRGADIVGRYGGEEILVGLVGADLERSTQIAEDLRAKVEDQKIMVGDKEITVTASFGVAAMRAGMTLQQLLAEADEALYRAKSEGRNRVEGYE